MGKERNDGPNQEEQKQEVTQSTPATSQVSTIRALVKANLSNANDAVKDAIVAKYKQEEIDKRVKATTVVLEKVEALESEARKIKPTPQGYSLTGAPVGEMSYTQDQVKQLRENKEKLAKLEAALVKAFVENDFTKVYEQGNKQ